MLLRWETVFEAGVLYYDLHRLAPAGWQPVNPEPIAAANLPAGGRYECPDATAPIVERHRYRLGAVLDSGRPVELGEYEVSARESAPVWEPRRRRIKPLRASASAADTASRAVPAGAVQPVDWVDLRASDVAVKLTTRGRGPRFVSAARLAALIGQPVAAVQGWIDHGELSMSNQGRSVTFIPGGAAGLTGLWFFAEEWVNNYTEENVYWIRGGTNRFATEDGQNPPAAVPGTYPATDRREVDRIPLLSLARDAEADFWMWAGILVNQGRPSGSFATRLTLDHVARGPGQSGTLELGLYGGSATPHQVRVSLNDTPLGEHHWAGTVPSVARLEVDPDTLRDAGRGEGSNTLLIESVLPPGEAVSQVYVDGFRLTWNRSYFATGDAVELCASGNPVVTVPGFSGPAVLALAIDNPRHPRLVTNLTVETVGGGWQASFVPTPASAWFVLFGASHASEPIAMSLARPAGLSDPSTRAGYVAIAPASLATGAAVLATYRSAWFRTKVVLLEDIYNEFNAGLASPKAIARFLETAWAGWALKPRYVVLIGDGTYDYRDLTASGDALVPPLLIGTRYGLAASDSLYGDVLGDGLPRVAIGRLPVLDPAELEAILAKVERYEAEAVPAPLQSLLVADAPDPGGDFVGDVNRVAADLAPQYASRLAAQMPLAFVRSSIQDALREGIDLLDYIGHGATDRLGAAGYLTVEDAADLANDRRLPVVVAMTCVAGAFSNPTFDCLAEALLMQPTSGAVAVVAPTGLSLNDEATRLNRTLAQVLGRHTTGRLGDVLGQTFAHYNRTGSPVTPAWIYNLLGDPALAVRAARPVAGQSDLAILHAGAAAAPPSIERYHGPRP